MSWLPVLDHKSEINHKNTCPGQRLQKNPEKRAKNMEIEKNELKFMDPWDDQLHTSAGVSAFVGYGVFVSADMALLSVCDDDGYGDVVLWFMFLVYGISR